MTIWSPGRALDPVAGVLIRRGEGTGGHGGDGQAKAEAAAGGTRPRPASTGPAGAGGGGRTLPRPSGEHGPAGTFASEDR